MCRTCNINYLLRDLGLPLQILKHFYVHSTSADHSSSIPSKCCLCPNGLLYQYLARGKGRRFKPLPGSVVRPCRLFRPSPAQSLPVVIARILVNRARQHLGVARARAADESARPPSLSIGLRRDDGVLRAGEGGDPAALEFG